MYVNMAHMECLGVMKGWQQRIEHGLPVFRTLHGTQTPAYLDPSGYCQSPIKLLSPFQHPNKNVELRIAALLSLSLPSLLSTSVLRKT